jgi:FtsP/CotA-like multicopper oxidase with cupredoxin domain
MDVPRLTRRDTLKLGAFATAAMAVPLSVSLNAGVVSRLDKKYLVPYLTEWSTPPVATGTSTLPGGLTDERKKEYEGATQFIRIQQGAFDAQILKGVTTRLFGYGQVDGSGVFQGAVPGPTIRVGQNEKVVVRQSNKLPATHPTLGYTTWTSTHLHGSPSKPQYDGYASDITQPGEWKDYVYENKMTPRTLWYHDHGVHHTAENAYMGLAGQYHCTHGDSVNGVVLPNRYGWNDFPMMIADKAFASNGQLMFDDNGHSSTFGDVITVNGKAWPVMKVEPRVYRFRMLNASTSRGYKVALSTGKPMALIGTDAGLTTKVTYLSSFRIGMAERYEILVDFSAHKPGDVVDLKNLGVPNAPTFDNTDKIMRFQVVAAAPNPQQSVPMPPDGQVLFPDAPAMDKDLPLTSTVAATRNLELTRNNGEWTVGPYTWEEVIASGYKKAFANPRPGTVERWIVKNSSGGWFHPVHIHLVDFRVVKRNGGAPFPWEATGGKDVIYVGENETVELLMRFHDSDHGRYMIHCHNLTHEDHDMMTQFVVGDEVADHDGCFADGATYVDEKGNPVRCDRDDPIYAAHPCDHADA